MRATSDASVSLLQGGAVGGGTTVNWMLMLRPPDHVQDGFRAMRSASIAPNRVALFSAQVNGTCRLGVNPATSGCSPSGERHGVRGLYIMDGSLLPTAPDVNPQWTIMAMASLLAERALT